MAQKPGYSSAPADSLDPKAVLEVCLCYNLRRASRAITRIYDTALAPTGLTAGQFFILAAVGALQPMPMPVLRETLAMDRTSLGRTLKPMEDRGFLTLSRGAGRRAGQVSLTDEGAAAFREAAPLWRTAQAAATLRVGTARSGQLLTGLSIATALLHQ